MDSQEEKWEKYIDESMLLARHSEGGTWQFHTCDYIEASFMENTREHFETDDGVNYNDKKNKKSDVKQRDHCHEDSIKDYLKTFEEKQLCYKPFYYPNYEP